MRTVKRGKKAVGIITTTLQFNEFVRKYSFTETLVGIRKLFKNLKVKNKYSKGRLN